MARVLANPFGEMRGKMAGGVFSRSKAGQIMRAYAKPTNVNSTSQKNTRNLFRSSANGYSVLTDTEQAGWREFAKSMFNPLNKTNTGQFTGSQSFKSLHMGVDQGNANVNPFEITADLTSLNLGHTITPYVFSSTAPSSSVRPNILDVAGSFLPFQISEASVSTDGIVSFRLAWLGVGGSGLTNGDFLDENGKAYGLSVYVSDAMRNLGSRPKNPMFYNLGNTGLITFSAGDLAGSDNAFIRLDGSSKIVNFKGFPPAGTYVQVTLAVIGSEGTMSIAASTVCIVTV